VSAAERRKKIVESHFVGEIFHRNAKRNAPALFFVQQVIGPRSEVEQVARSHAIRIVIVVLRAGLREGKEFGRPGTVAGCDRVAVGSEGSR
jgi:hypothetical protein